MALTAPTDKRESLMKVRNRRYRLLADWKLQGHLCLRICIYWVVCQTAMIATIIGFIALAGDPDVGAANDGSPWRFIVPGIVASSLFLPIVLLDCLKYSNKFAGPLLRLQKSMKMLAERKTVSPLCFRPGDYLINLATQFNEIRSHVEWLEESQSDTSAEVYGSSFDDQMSSWNCSKPMSVK